MHHPLAKFWPFSDLTSSARAVNLTYIISWSS
jgi:hypothetical protein